MDVVAECSPGILKRLWHESLCRKVIDLTWADLIKEMINSTFLCQINLVYLGPRSCKVLVLFDWLNDGANNREFRIGEKQPGEMPAYKSADACDQCPHISLPGVAVARWARREYTVTN